MRLPLAVVVFALVLPATAAAHVLLDDIDDPSGVRDHSIQLTLPMIECDACVLQLIQVMTDKAPWGPGGLAWPSRRRHS